MLHCTQQCSLVCLVTGCGESEKVQQPQSEAHVRTQCVHLDFFFDLTNQTHLITDQWFSLNLTLIND